MRQSILLIAAALVAFGLSLGGSFHFDDYALFNDPDILSPAATRPLTNLTFWINEQTGGRSPVGYHAVNLLLHLTTVLLLRAALALVVAPDAALIAALLFALHPIQTEPVNYIFARGTLLATLLCVSSLRSWLQGHPWRAVAWFGAALLAKEECVAFPIFLAMLGFSCDRVRRDYRAISAMLLLAIAAGARVLLATAQVQSSGTGFTAKVDWIQYASMQGIAILRYLRMLFLPWGFTIDPQLPQPAMSLRVLAWVMVAAAALIALRRSRDARSGFWFMAGLVLLLPSSSVFNADDFAADRRMYLPMIAFSAALGILLARLDRRVLAIVLVALAAISVRYTLIWETERSLWAEAVERAPGKVRPLIQLSRAAETPAEALRILSQAQKIAPDDVDVASEQGRELLTLGKSAEALSAFGRALSLSPRSPEAMNNRGIALLALGQADAARQDFTRALTENPCQFNALLNLKRIGISPAIPARCRYTAEQRAQLGQ